MLYPLCYKDFIPHACAEREEQIPVAKQLETEFKGDSMERKGLLLSLQSTILLLSWDKGACTWSAVGFLAYVMWSATQQ